MPEPKEQDDRARGEEGEEQDRETKDQGQEKEEQTSQVDHHIPAPPKKKKHRKRHWEHLPGPKRKPIRSFKSPGRK
jgi:hypothetical protein